MSHLHYNIIIKKKQDILSKLKYNIIRKKKAREETPGNVVFITPKYSINLKHRPHKKWSFFDIKT